MNQSGNPAAPSVSPPPAGVPPTHEDTETLTAFWTITVKSADHRKLLTFQYQQEDLPSLPPLGLIFQGPEWKDAQGHVVGALRLHVQQLIQTWGAPLVFITLIPAPPVASLAAGDPVPYLSQQFQQQFIAALTAMGFTMVRDVPLVSG